MTQTRSGRNAWLRSLGFVRPAFVLLQLVLLPVAAWTDHARGQKKDGTAIVSPAPHDAAPVADVSVSRLTSEQRA